MTNPKGIAMKKKTIRKVATATIVLSLLAILILFYGADKLPFAAQSFAGVQCTGDQIWLKYSLADEDSRLANLIDDCDDNKRGGFVGEVCFDFETPSGKTYRAACYTAEPISAQKISCGDNNGGKEFAGRNIPNEGFGTYKAVVSGHYRLFSEGYAIEHPFEWKEGTGVSCILPSSTCEDGTPLNTCSEDYKGKYCTASATLIDRANRCGCPDGMEPTVETCMPIGWDVEEEDPPIPEETTEIEETTTTTPTSTPTQPESEPAEIQPIDTSPPAGEETVDEIQLFGFPQTYVIGALIVIMLAGVAGLVMTRKK